MSESQTKIDAAAEKAFAEASLKSAGQEIKADAKPDSGSTVDLKAVAKAVDADAAAPAKPVETAKPIVAEKKPAKARILKKKVPAAKPASQRPVMAKKPAQPRTKPITKLKETIMATANKAKTTDFAATAKDAAAEIQTRAKAAYEKGTELTGEVTEFHKGNLEAIVESSKLLASGMQDMGRTYMEDARTAADTVTEDVKKMAAIKSPTELFQLQGEIARRNFDAAVAQTSKNTEAMMKLVTEAFAPLSNRASVAAEKVSNAA
ncbi:phasin family protein [Qipengyuania sp. SM2507]